MKVLDHIERAKSIKDFFERERHSKFLKVDESRLKDVNLFRLLSDLTERSLYETEFAVYVSKEGFRTIDYGKESNQIFRNSIGVVVIQCDLDDVTLFETEEDLNDYFEAYAIDRLRYVRNSIAFEVTSEMIDELLEQNRLKKIRFLKESIEYYENEIDRMTEELTELEKI